MANTTNFGWETPDDTDLVKDGAAAIRTLGSAIDTSLVDLKGGTTGQVLAKASNTDMDFTWATDASGIPATIFDAKGDIIAASAADTAARLAVGANNTVLTADSSTATGLKWAAPTASGANWSLLNSGGTALTGATTVTVSGISGVDKIMVLVQSASSVNAVSEIRVRLNGDTGGNYAEFGSHFQWGSTYDAGNYTGRSSLSENSIFLARMSNSASSFGRGGVTITGCNSSGVKAYSSVGSGTPTGSNLHETVILQGFYNSASTISSISVVSSTGNFDAGTVYVYTSAS